MRNYFFLVLFLFVFINKGFSDFKESFLIRRAYLDTIGRVPSIEELENYIVYKNGYVSAVEWLINQSKILKLSKDYLLSDSYKNKKREFLSEEQINKNIMFVTGYGKHAFTEETIKKARLSLVQIASDPELQSNYDTIDYMANCLMSRSTNIEEANKLTKIFREESKKRSETEAWMKVLEELIKFEDVITK